MRQVKNIQTHLGGRIVVGNVEPQACGQQMQKGLLLSSCLKNSNAAAQQVAWPAGTMHTVLQQHAVAKPASACAMPVLWPAPPHQPPEPPTCGMRASSLVETTGATTPCPKPQPSCHAPWDTAVGLPSRMEKG